ncbi:hypothetical protein AMS68_006142 [Peltaster fructicola]|uniref:3-hydroxyisobutyrate dehydrogenase n=1 Tax=Peltaster fructicola TaxID=286661 RepID=A0A6H0Y145_9PEZI|nr:hypothetical protein AMS68_006142 [Peltaster fructicola]
MSVLHSRIGWIGLGVMGLPMARNLLKHMPQDTQFFVYDISDENINAFISSEPVRGFKCASSREVAENSTIIFSMVPEGSHVRSVYLTPGTGVLAADLKEQTLIDCSTIDTATSLHVRAKCYEVHPEATFYDAPVSGGAIGAQKGTLTFMLGCAEDDPKIDLLMSLLGSMGSNIIPCGGPSFGLTAKLCNNYCSGLIAIAVSEAMNIGMASGMDPRILANVFHTSTAQSAICDDWCPVPGLCPEAPASKGYKGGFKVQLMKKDFSLAVDAAQRIDVQLALGAAGLRVYEQASIDPKCADLDSRVVYRYLGGREDWQKDFPSHRPLKRDETRALLARSQQ